MPQYNKPPPQVYLLRYHKPPPQDVLAHHGILGQKWGKRNGPPYPLSAQAHSESEKKAGWQKSLDKSGSEDYTGNKSSTDEQIDPSTGLKLGAKETIREAVTKVNPSGSETNCRACSIAAVLRMRGFDVEAIGSVQGGTISEIVEKSFKGARIAEIYSPTKDRVIKQISKFGEGSSGIMGGRYNTSRGKFEHAISWAVKDGTVQFFDGQKILGDYSKYLDYLDQGGSVEIARLDNLEINANGIKEFIKNR